MNAINSVLRNIPLTISSEGFIQPPPTRRYLVFVNPVGGTGNAVQIWNRIQPFLTFASIEYELLITERANHAKDVMATRDLDDITAVVIVGGDGLIFEVVSGLFARSDSEAQLQRIVFAPIPGGSGNGLIKSILHESGEEYSPENAMFVAIRGKSAPLDLSQVLQLCLFLLLNLLRLFRFKLELKIMFHFLFSVGVSSLTVISFQKECDGWVR